MVQLTKRQMQRAADMNAQGRRKLPFFVDPIEHKLKIEKDDLMDALYAQITERKVLNVILDSAQYEDVPLEVEKTVGKTSHDIDANEVIWSFFVTKHLPAQAPPQPKEQGTEQK